uniref:Cysteine desulfurase n=1 Tax=Ignisphaera aggregans TaxID=334771 RepID=A0A7C2V8J3_9CREN
MLKVAKIKEDFPIFRSNPDLVYLDNAATTHKPVHVIEAIRDFYTNFNANIHRGVYRLSVKATEMFEEAHAIVAKFIGAAKWYEVIFTKNTTDSINMLAYALLNHLQQGDEIVVTVMEHHSNMLPWIRLAELRNLNIKFVEVTPNGTLKYDQLSELVTRRTKVVSFTHVSNVLGTINDVDRIVKIVRQESDAIIILDGAQSVPHMPINVKSLGVDFLVFSGHKMLGPTGIGVLWGREDLLKMLSPAVYGGDMIESVEITVQNGAIVSKNIKYAVLPWKFEAGTPNIAAGIGLARAVEYLSNLGMENVRDHEKMLTDYAIKRMQEELEDRVSIVGPRDASMRGGLVSFNLHGIDPHVVATLLSMNNIAIRAGFHCAQPLHIHLGLKRGTARASFYVYNDINDIEVFVEELKKISVMASR